MNAGKCDNCCYSKKLAKSAGEGGIIVLQEGGEMHVSYVELNIYPHLYPADSH